MEISMSSAAAPRLRLASRRSSEVHLRFRAWRCKPNPREIIAVHAGEVIVALPSVPDDRIQTHASSDDVAWEVLPASDVP